MATPRKLRDIQLLLLSAAAIRPDRSLLPPSTALGELSKHIRAAISGLLKRAFAEEIDVDDVPHTWRMDGDCLVGVAITAAGLCAINADVEGATGYASELLPTAPSKATKISLVVELLLKDGGATLPELTGATGWLPHTTRAVLTGLRKKGHLILSGKVDGVTSYRIGAPA